MIIVHFHTDVNAEASGLEGLVGWIIWVGIESKSWATFAFLFGVGFAVLMRRLEARGAPVVAFYLRRLAGLAFFGILAEGLFGFHVLLGYAIWGVPLLFLRRLSTPALLAIAVVAVALNSVVSVGAALHWWPPLLDAATADARRQLYLAAETAQKGDSYLALVAARFQWMQVKYSSLPVLMPDVSLTLFIIGLLAVRTGVIDDARAHRRLIVGWMVFGFVAWALSWLVLYRIPDLSVRQLTWALRYGFGVVHEQWLCFTYIGAVLLLLAYRPAWYGRLAPIGAAGRMALTNYMLQVAAIDFIASGYGLSLKLRPLLGVVGAALLFSAEVAFSRWWLKRYLFGPCEWLWRSMTYGRLQPMRRARPVTVPMSVM
jgi:uncharacterized protein